GDLGMHGITVAEEDGGLGLGYIEHVIAVEEVARASASLSLHNFAGYKQTHGQHEYQRHGGSIGMNMTPGRTFKGKKMAGQHGNKKVTVQNLKVVQVLAEEGLVLVEGAVPGPRGGIVLVRTAVKKKAKTPPSA
ncbi:MAG: acyl-CoA dehydrogenase family protein, partial [Myxococcota bacterium]